MDASRQNDVSDAPDSPEGIDSEENGEVAEAYDEDSTDNQLVKKLVRYALACEYSRTPIRRDGIKDKGLLGPSCITGIPTF